MTIFNQDASVLGAFTLNPSNATGDILTIDGTGVVRFRTYAQILADIGAGSIAIPNNLVAVGTGTGIEGLTGFSYDSASQIVGIGIDDTDAGILSIYGDTAASLEGGQTRWYGAADYDANVDYWRARVNGFLFALEANTTGGSLNLTNTYALLNSPDKTKYVQVTDTDTQVIGDLGVSLNLGVTNNILGANLILTTGGTILRNVTNSNLNLGGDSSIGTGGEIQLYGSTHATLAHDILFKSNNVTVGQYDFSLATWLVNKLRVNGTLAVDTILNATVDTDRFLVDDSGTVKYRTGSELLSDIGGVSASLVGSAVEEEKEFAGGETTWVLSGTPSSSFPHRLYAGSSGGGGLILLDLGIDYTLSGNTITYLSPVLPIDPDEKHIIHYNLPGQPSWFSDPNSDVKIRNADVYEPVNTSAYYKNGTVYDSRNLQLLVITDLHGDTTAVQNAITMMNEFSTIDGGLNLGDTCINNFLDDFTFVDDLMDIGKPFLIAIGNHDEGTGKVVATTGTTAQAYAKFVQPYEASIGGTHAGKSYYYKDWTTYKIRHIILYEYDDNDDIDPGDSSLYRVSKSARVWSQAQIDWLITTLNNTPTDYSVIISMHQVVVDQLTWIEGLFTDINHIAPGDSFTLSDPDLIPEIINAWINGTTLVGSYPFTGDASYKTAISVNLDFSSRGAGKFICYIAGHAHVDAVGTVPGYSDQLQLVFTCATSDASRNQYGDLQRQVGQRSEDCFNIVSFDTANEKIKVVRIGARITFDMRERDYIEIPY